MRTEHVILRPGGMICRACEDAVERSLYSLRGVISAKASYWRGSAEIDFDPDIVSLESMESALGRAGYPVGKGGIGGIVLDTLCLLLTGLITLLLLNLKGSPVARLMSENPAVSLGHVFLMGLLTSTHCIAMCGGIILSQTTQTDSLKPARSRTLRASLRYNLGRVLSYTALGGIFGALGTVISYTAKAKSIVFVMAGLAVTLMGLRMLGLLPRIWGLPERQTSFCAVPIKAREKAAGRPFAVGLLTGLMPCAPLYAMWLYAMGTGSLLGGGAAMLCFALGTVPLLLIFGLLGAFVPERYYKYMLKAGAVLVCSMGLRMLVKGVLLGV